MPRITSEVGIPDIIFNNAGSGRWLAWRRQSPTKPKMMAAPYFAAFFVTRAFLPDMLKGNSGYIVNMTSAASRLVWPGATAYIAARWAMHGFTEALRADLNDTGIRVMLVSFAKVASSYWENNPGSEERLPKAQSMMRVLTPGSGPAIVKGIKRDKQEVVAPFMLRFVFALNYFFPNTTRRMMSAGDKAEEVKKCSQQYSFSLVPFWQPWPWAWVPSVPMPSNHSFRLNSLRRITRRSSTRCTTPSA